MNNQNFIANGSNLIPLMSGNTVANNWPETLISSSSSAQQIVSVAYSLYTYGAFWFLLLSLILLLAMIAPIYLSRK
jgi:NADH:ubiquinone oxidoreductase subunit 6 (subunit J)